ncbi:MAG: inositol monophosphatase [Desulfobacter sp.]|nr:MAG: inositol monophosphatase [Desulfobacter sp.]
MISFIKRLAQNAGQICLKDQTALCPSDLKFKSPKNIVTAIDQKVEQFIIREIQSAYPGHGILGEETGSSNQDSPYRWIIDPIDGTTSFVHNQPFYAVSIGVEKNGQLILGAVYAPVFDQLFYGEKGKGAFLNDAPIKVSATKEMNQAVMATGFACLRSDLKKNNLGYFNKIVPKLRDIRRYGSAAMDLCYTACGRVDGFWEMNLNLYDIAAGALILKEAGGTVTDFSGKTNFPQQGIAAANGLLHPQLLNCLKE